MAEVKFARCSGSLDGGMLLYKECHTCVRLLPGGPRPVSVSMVNPGDVVVGPCRLRATDKEQAWLAEFIRRAGFSWGWENLESSARRMAEQAYQEIHNG